MPVSAAFIEVKINDIEKRIKESQKALDKGLNDEADKRCHIQEEHEMELSPALSSTLPKQKSMFLKTKDVLHRKSGFLNKFKDTQRSQASLANGNPCQ